MAVAWGFAAGGAERFGCGLGLVMLMSGGLAAAPTRAAVPPRDPMSLDVAGIRLGADAESAAASATSAGYVCTRVSNARTFADAVAIAVARRAGDASLGREGRALHQIDCRAAAGETLQAVFAQTPSGPVVAAISWRAPLSSVDRAALLRQLAAKYGVSPAGRPGLGCWTRGGEFCGVRANGPTFRVDDLGSAIAIEADRGAGARHADEAAVEAAAGRIRPKARGAAL